MYGRSDLLLTHLANAILIHSANELRSSIAQTEREEDFVLAFAQARCMEACGRPFVSP